MSAVNVMVIFLRQDLGLNSTHIGCEHACAVCRAFLNGAEVRFWLPNLSASWGFRLHVLLQVANGHASIDPRNVPPQLFG
jgi:hypothetical protein